MLLGANTVRRTRDIICGLHNAVKLVLTLSRVTSKAAKVATTRLGKCPMLRLAFLRGETTGRKYSCQIGKDSNQRNVLRSLVESSFGLHQLARIGLFIAVIIVTRQERPF